ncbi:MAG: hypothetical protein WBO10_09630 [Pyrinomonadaceae bacterium]
MKRSVVIVTFFTVVLLFVGIVLVWLVKPYYPYMGNDFVIPSPTRTPVPPDVIELSEEDKVQIVSEILRQLQEEDAKDTKGRRADRRLDLLEGSLPVSLAKLDRTRLNVHLITRQQIADAKQTREVEWYEFREFNLKSQSPILPLVWTKRDRSSSHMTGSEFTATRIGDKWSVEGKVTSVAVGESP